MYSTAAAVVVPLSRSYVRKANWILSSTHSVVFFMVLVRAENEIDSIVNIVL